MIPLVRRVTYWYCPNCHKESVTFEAKPHMQTHVCPKLAMLSAPMLQKGVRAKVERVLRQDYVGKEIVRKDADGKVPMSIVTTRDNGQDAIVFAPTATGRSD